MCLQTMGSREKSNGLWWVNLLWDGGRRRELQRNPGTIARRQSADSHQQQQRPAQPYWTANIFFWFRGTWNCFVLNWRRASQKVFNYFTVIEDFFKHACCPATNSEVWESSGEGRLPMAFTVCGFHMGAHWHSCTQWSMLVFFSALGEKSHGVLTASPWIWITFFCVLLY